MREKFRGIASYAGTPLSMPPVLGFLHALDLNIRYLFLTCFFKTPSSFIPIFSNTLLDARLVEK